MQIAAKAKFQGSATPKVTDGMVVDVEEGQQYVVETEAGELNASLAFSCLVSPEPGDIVLVAIYSSGTCYVLAVLERPNADTREKKLSVAGDLVVEAPDGAIRIAAAEGVAVTTREELALRAPELKLETQTGEIRIQQLSYFGNLFSGQVEKIRWIADTVDSICRRLVQKLTASYRYVEEHEEVQSASMRFLVDGTMVVQTKDTIHTAEGQIKFDAEQIHEG